ncbi:MAG: hypothetical protein OXF49_01610 [Candidatus Saccharibacteria bacterium]|nr:hypothetical protein [Candidatus Saccharibacteria bacterium]
MIFINFSRLLILSVVILGFHLQSPFSAQAQADISVPSASFRQTALKHLTRLIKTYNISLNTAEINLVTDNCQDILKTSIPQLLDDTNQTAQVYQSLIEIIQSSLNFISDDLRHMTVDSSNIDLVLVDFSQLEANFQTDLRAYKLSLNELLSLNVNCHYHPQAFVAGLQEADSRRQLIEASAEAMLDYINKEIEEVLAEIQADLLTAENQQHAI